MCSMNHLSWLYFAVNARFFLAFPWRERERTVPARQEPQFSDVGTTALAQGVSDIHPDIVRVHRPSLARADFGCSSRNTYGSELAAATGTLRSPKLARTKLAPPPTDHLNLVAHL